MAKGKLLQDTFEQLAELGTSTAKQTVKSMAQIVNPFTANETNGPNNVTNSPESGSKNNHTPLNFDKLKNNFQDKEKAKMDSLRNRLFQMVKSEEEKAVVEMRQKEMQKKRQEEYEKQQKDQAKQRQIMEQSQSTPHGKLKGNNAQRRKAAAQQQQAEMKPSTGKQ